MRFGIGKNVVFVILLSILMYVNAGAEVNQFDPTQFTDKFKKEIDLDGDGRNEKIRVSYEQEENRNVTFLYINDKKAAKIVWNPYSFYKIIDIDKNDKFVEIETYCYGKSYDNTVKLLSFDRNIIVDMGAIEKSYKIVADGTGIVKGAIRANLLSGEMFTPMYRLTKEHLLEEITTNSNQYDVDIDVVLKKPIQLQVSPIDARIACTFKTGDKAKIIKTDKIEWCMIENTDGLKGWFAIDKFHIIRGIGMSTAEVFDGLYKMKSVDLNGDGKEENVYIIEAKGDILVVNNAYLPVVGTGSTWGFVDIDKSDKYIEVAMDDEGPSDDYSTSFYYYNDRNFVPMGTVGGLLRYGVVIDGSGTFDSHERGNILHTWFYKQRNRLNQDHKVEPIQQGVIEMNTKVAILKELKLQKTPYDSRISLVLMPGDKATITMTDDKEWCLVENINGEKGWFSINYLREYPGDYFEGLCFAD